MKVRGFRDIRKAEETMGTKIFIDFYIDRMIL